MAKNIGYAIAIYVAVLATIVSAIITYMFYFAGYEPQRYGGVLVVSVLAGVSIGVLVSLAYVLRYYDDLDAIDSMPYASRSLLFVGLILAVASLVPCQQLVCVVTAFVSYTGISLMSAGLAVLVVWVASSTKAYYNATIKLLASYRDEVHKLVQASKQ